MNKNKKIYITLAILLLVLVTTLTITSFYQRNKTINTPVLYSGEESVNQIEYAFYYTTILNGFYSTYENYLDTMGLDLDEDLYEQECYFDNYDSWGDFFDETTKNTIQKRKALYDEAQKNNFKYDYSEKYSQFKEQVKEQADKNKTSIKNMYTILYGKYATEKEIKEYFVQYYTAYAYETELRKNIDITDEEIEKRYNETADDYDLISYRDFIIYADINDDMSDEEKQKAMNDAKEKAKTFYDKVYDEETFESLCNEYSETYQSNESLHINENIDAVSSVISEWLFDCTEEKQTTYIEDNENNCYHIVYFKERHRDDASTVSMRHILITPEVSDITSYLPSDDDYKKALNKITEIEKEFEKDKTEDNFKKLAEKYSEDNGSSSNSGLITNISNGQMEDSINNWLFDSSRKTGDYEIIKSSYGYHLLYFVDTGEPDWKLNIRLDLLDEKMDSKISELTKGYEIKDVN